MNDNTPANYEEGTARSTTPRRGWRYALLPVVIMALTSLACGSFVPRPTPVPRPTATPIIETSQTQATAATPDATPTLELPTSVPTRDAPTPTFTPTPVPGTAIIVGQPARVAATQGLNVRRSASASGDRLGRYPPGAIVSVLEGPTEADGYTWWRVGNNELAGWVAEGDGEVTWLSPDLGSTQPVDRPVQLGDDVLVTVGATGVLSIRASASTSGRVEHQVPDRTQLTVVEGPIEANGYRWWKVTNESGNITGWAAEGSGDDRWLTPLE